MSLVGVVLLALTSLTSLINSQSTGQPACGEYSGDPFYHCGPDSKQACEKRECCWDEENKDCFYSPSTVYTQDGCTFVRAFHIVEEYATLCDSKGAGNFESVEGCIQLSCEDTATNAFNYQLEDGACFTRSCTLPVTDDNLQLTSEHGGREIWVRVYDYCEDSARCGPGTCVQTSAREYTCTCPAGLTGPNCAENIDDCVEVTCHHGGECIDALDSYFCDCPEGFDGVHCEIDNYNCGMDISARIDCDSDTADQCYSKGCCWVDGICFHGWNTTMVLSDTCTYIRVHDTTEGIATYCSDDSVVFSNENSLEECLTEACDGGPSLYNAVNMHLGKSCVLRKCDTPLTEENLLLDITTSAHVGRDIWILVLDYCEENLCENGGTCKNTERYFTCICPAGYTGELCQTDIDECLSNPCQHGSTCKDHVNHFTCECAEGYTSERCETDIDDCADNPCVHGVCVDGVNAYTCDCDAAYTGDHCDEEINECASNPCQNGGQCVDQLGSYKCDCPQAYTGINCQDLNECGSNPCQNGGTCLDKVNSYSCQCTDGFSGENCQQEDLNQGTSDQEVGNEPDEEATGDNSGVIAGATVGALTGGAVVVGAAMIGYKLATAASKVTPVNTKANTKTSQPSPEPDIDGLSSTVNKHGPVTHVQEFVPHT